MKNLCKFLGIAALIVLIAFSMAACDSSGGSGGSGRGGGGGGGGYEDDDVGLTDGRLTITGLDSYNGEWIIAADHDVVGLIAAAGMTITGFGSGILTGGKVSSERVTLKVWKENKSAPPSSYKGNDTATFDVIVISKPTATNEELDSIQGNTEELDWFIVHGTVTVTFIDGIASGTFVPDSDIVGKLTITGFDSEDEGKWVVADVKGPIRLVAAKSISSDRTITFEQVTDGKVVLNVWKEDGSELVDYNGNDSFVLDVGVFDIESATPNDLDELDNGPPFDGWFLAHGTVLVNFINGVAFGEVQIDFRNN